MTHESELVDEEHERACERWRVRPHPCCTTPHPPGGHPAPAWGGESGGCKTPGVPQATWPSYLGQMGGAEAGAAREKQQIATTSLRGPARRGASPRLPLLFGDKGGEGGAT